MSKVLIFYAEGFEEIEGLTPVDILQRAGIEVTMVSITKKDTVTGSHNITISTDTTIEKIDFEQFDGLILPGGPGYKNLLENDEVNEQIKKFNKEKKLVAAICAAPSILGMAGLLKNKKACCFPGFEDKLLEANISYEGVVVDENIITGRGMGQSIPFSLAIVAYLADKETENKVKETIIL